MAGGWAPVVVASIEYDENREKVNCVYGWMCECEIKIVFHENEMESRKCRLEIFFFPFSFTFPNIFWIVKRKKKIGKAVKREREQKS